MKKGFTLVELSIVLVIIGLLIGGILVAQSMILTSEVQSLLRRIQQYEIAMTNFHTNYKTEPGDSTYFTPAGNGNGYVGIDAGCSGVYSTRENYQVWAHLTQAGMIKESFVSYQPTLACGGTHGDYAADSSIGVVQPFIAKVPGLAASWWGGDSNRAGLEYSNAEPVWGVPRHFFTLLPGKYVLPLDAKLDDGAAYTGRLMRSDDDGNPCTMSSVACAVYYYPDGTAP